MQIAMPRPLQRFSRYRAALSKIYLMMVLFVMAIPSFAQSTIDIDIDLSNFWVGFNEFFNALSGPMFFIAAIPAALGFITMIALWLRKAFTSGA